MHTFCKYCINQWRTNSKSKKTQENGCPICRAPITFLGRNLLIDNVIGVMVNLLTEEKKKSREDLFQKRREMPSIHLDSVPSSARSNIDHQQLLFEMEQGHFHISGMPLFLFMKIENLLSFLIVIYTTQERETHRLSIPTAERVSSTTTSDGPDEVWTFHISEEPLIIPTPPTPPNPPQRPVVERPTRMALRTRRRVERDHA